MAFKNRYSVSMRILHTIHSVNPAGGGPIEFVRLLVPLYNKEGHEVVVASMDDPEAEYVKNFPAQVFACGPSMPGYGFTPRFSSWMHANRNSFDAVIINGIWQFNGLATWWHLRGSGTPYLLFPHGMLDPWFRQAYPVKHLKKSVYWGVAEKRVVRDASAVMFTSEQERLNAQSTFRPYNCREIVVGYGCTDPAGDSDQQREMFLKMFPSLRGKRIILFIGRMHEKKGCDLLLQAFSSVANEFPQIELVMAGPDAVGYGARLKSRLDIGIRDRVTWTGMLSGDLKWGAIRSSEAMILPSHQENFGLVVAEALACHTPVLLSNKVNIWRDVVDDEAGLVAADDLEG
jgi:glycosyltransferase involved in cell wall biosynthesis